MAKDKKETESKEVVLEPELKATADAFIENRKLLRKAFFVEEERLNPVCTAVMMRRAGTFNVESEQAQKCKQVLSEKTGFFSNFRSVKMPLLCYLLGEEDPAGVLEDGMECYKELKEEFKGSQYLAYVSCVLAGLARNSGVSPVSKAERAKRIHRAMDNIDMLDSPENSIFSMMMAFSGKSDDDLVRESDHVYDDVSRNIFSADSMQAISIIMSMTEGSWRLKCARMMEIVEPLSRCKNLEYARSYEMAILALLASINVPTDTLSQAIIDTDRYLSKQRGYKFLGAPARARAMHAALVVACRYVRPEAALSAEPCAALALDAAENAAMIACMYTTYTNSKKPRRK